jgi:hypothetical protein
MKADDKGVILGVFFDRGTAEKAIDELHHAGFSDREVGMLTRGGDVVEAKTATGVQESNAAEGAVAGALAGGTVGAVTGALVSLLIPGLGPVITGGLLTVVLASTAAGAAGGSLIGPFIALGLSEDEAHYYEGQFSAGRTILAIRANGRAEEARRVLRRHGADGLAPEPVLQEPVP